MMTAPAITAIGMTHVVIGHDSVGAEGLDVTGGASIAGPRMYAHK